MLPLQSSKKKHFWKAWFHLSCSHFLVAPQNDNDPDKQFLHNFFFFKQTQQGWLSDTLPRRQNLDYCTQVPIVILVSESITSFISSGWQWGPLWTRDTIVEVSSFPFISFEHCTNYLTSLSFFVISKMGLTSVHRGLNEGLKIKDLAQYLTPRRCQEMLPSHFPHPNLFWGRDNDFY